MMTTAVLIENLQQDYARFPEAQTYSLYAEDVRFQDPLNSFVGRARYEKMIGFLSRFFRDIEMDLHRIGDRQLPAESSTAPPVIETDWTLHMTAPLPWSPRLSIPGRSELTVKNGLISAHVDYWHCSRWAVMKQVLPG